jgi:hypothetical protein
MRAALKPRRPTDHTSSFEEYHEHCEEDRQVVKRKQRQRQAILSNFVKLSTGRLTFYQNRNESIVTGLSRHTSTGDIFLKFVDDAFVDRLIGLSHETQTEGKLPYKSRPSNTLGSRQLVYQYFVQRIKIMSNPAKRLADNFPMTGVKHPIGYDSFKQLLCHLHIHPELTALLDYNFRLYLIPGRVITLDEKLEPFKGSSPYKRYVPNKQPKVGHWISELTTKTPATGLPYTLRQLPFLGKQTMKGVFEWATEGLSTINQPIIVSDPYYLDDASLVFLRDKQAKFLCAVAPIRFRELWEEFSDDVKRVGDIAAYRNASTGELGLISYDAHFGKQHILTNAFEWVEDKSKPINLGIVTDAYRFYFNSCDRFNHLIGNKRWPYRRGGWTSSYDDFYFSTILMNVYVLYHENTSKTVLMGWQAFMDDLWRTLERILIDKAK